MLLYFVFKRKGMELLFFILCIVYRIKAGPSCKVTSCSQETSKCSGNTPNGWVGHCNGILSGECTSACGSTAVDGAWSTWGTFTTCDVTCNGGTKSRSRTCNNPTPQNGGATCPGSDTEILNCNTSPCPVNGVWSVWGVFTTCDVTCDGGTKSRSRTCDNPAPQNGGSTCSGLNTEIAACNTSPCPVNGAWTTWEAFTICDVTCGGGTKSRSRICDNPAPQNGGSTCSGLDTEIVTCNTSPCPVNGAWSAWGGFTICDVTCDDGTKSRSRTCDNPAPQNGGSTCSGLNTEIVVCNTSPCPVNGAWSTWGAFTICDVTCGGGTKSRSRTCDNPAPQNGGSTCSGLNTEIVACNTSPCPVNGAWTTWGAFTICDVTCGSGTKSRSRTCDNPAPQNGGSTCSGLNTEIVACNRSPCPVVTTTTSSVPVSTIPLSTNPTTTFAESSTSSITKEKTTNGEMPTEETTVSLTALVSKTTSNAVAAITGETRNMTITSAETLFSTAPYTDTTNNVNTKFITTPETTSFTETDSQISGCICMCSEDNRNITLDEKIEELKNALLIKKSTLSSSKRKLISAHDDRPSAKGVGIVGIAFIMIILISIVGPDCYNGLCYFRKSICHQESR